MGRQILPCAAAVMTLAAITLAAGAGITAGEATAAIKATTDKILAVVNDPELQKPGTEAGKRDRIRKIADERFAWAEMARRSLGRSWAKFSAAQQQEFVPLFTSLIYGAYMDKVADYKGEQIVYKGEKPEGNYSTVSVTIVTDKNTETPVEYRLMNDKGQWLIYDVSIEGVSLINNYRTQFSDFLTNGTPDKLIAKLKEKTAQGTSRGQ